MTQVARQIADFFRSSRRRWTLSEATDLMQGQLGLQAWSPWEPQRAPSKREVCRRTGAATLRSRMASCTAGLHRLASRALGLEAGRRESSCRRSRFAATGQALLWNALVPVFCDCLPGTRTLDPADVERNLSSAHRATICSAYVYAKLPRTSDALSISRFSAMGFRSTSIPAQAARGNPLGTTRGRIRNVRSVFAEPDKGRDGDRGRCRVDDATMLWQSIYARCVTTARTRRRERTWSSSASPLV